MIARCEHGVHLRGDSKSKDYRLCTLPRVVLSLLYTALRLKVLSNTSVGKSFIYVGLDFVADRFTQGQLRITEHKGKASRVL